MEVLRTLRIKRGVWLPAEVSVTGRMRSVNDSVCGLSGAT